MSVPHVAPGGARSASTASRDDDPRVPAISVAMVVASSILALVMPAYLLASVPDTARSTAWVVTLGVMVWAGLRLAWRCVSGRPSLFDFFFWLFVYIFMGMAPTIQIRADQVSTTTPAMDPGVDLPTSLVVVLGLVMYEAGRTIVRGRWSQHESGDAGSVTQVDLMRTVVLVVVGLLATSYFLAKVGPGVLLGSREAAFATRDAAWPDPAIRSIAYAAAIYPLLIATGALAQLRQAAARRPFGAVITTSLVGCVALLLLVVNPVSSARYTFGTVAFALIIFLGGARSVARVRATMVFTVFGFLFAFPLADAFRSDSGVRPTRNGFFGEYLANPDYDSFWQVANAYTYWLDGMVEPLRQILGSLLFWVPRAIWPGKPTDTGIVLAQYRGYFFENLSAPLWAEALVNGGLIVVVIVFLVTGYALARMDHRLTHVFADGGLWAIIGAVFPVYMTILLRGSLLQATGALAISAACVLTLRRSRAAEPTVPMGQHEPSVRASKPDAGR